MTSPYEPPLSSDFLFVKLLVKAPGEPAFFEGMVKTEKTVFDEKLKWKLIRAGRRIFPEPEQGYAHYLHLWQADNPINLWKGQSTVAGDSDYAALYRSVDREVQDILRLTGSYSPTRALSERAKPYLLVHDVKLAKDWSRMLDWQWNLPVPIGNGMFAPDSFRMSFAFQAVTGLLRHHFQFFESDAVDLLERVNLGDSAPPQPAITLERLRKLNDPTLDEVPGARPNNLPGLESEDTVTRVDVELYERIVYQDQLSRPAFRSVG